MRPEAALARLVKKHGIRRAVVLLGAATVVAVRGWDVLVGDEAYSRQGVWLWRRDLEAAGVDPLAVEWGGFERGVSSNLSNVILAGNRLDKKARKVVADSEARRRSSVRARKSTAARS